MPGKRHLGKDKCRKCNGCAARRFSCRLGHVICLCKPYVHLWES